MYFSKDSEGAIIKNAYKIFVNVTRYRRSDEEENGYEKITKYLGIKKKI